MTALLELKQKIKEIYGQYEMYILPVMRFVLALVYFLFCADPCSQLCTWN